MVELLSINQKWINQLKRKMLSEDNIAVLPSEISTKIGAYLCLILI